jgi:hypothetical protein
MAETRVVESLDVLAIMSTRFKASGERLYMALSLALLAACAANLMLVCSWLHLVGSGPGF